MVGMVELKEVIENLERGITEMESFDTEFGDTCAGHLREIVRIGRKYCD